MRAQVLTAPGTPLAAADLPPPRPGAGQLLLRVRACAVCRTDLHIVDGELAEAKLPLVPGHEIVGEVVALGPGADGFAVGDRVGVPWLGWTCGVCEFCRAGRENLCDRARFIGYRSLRLAGDGERLGLYGFGAAAHIVAQVARHQGRRVFAFTRPGDAAAQHFARSLGAVWAGGSDAGPPEPLEAALIFASVGTWVPAALAATRKGGTVVCGGIHMSDIPQFPYRLLWEERVVRSVANLTRRDAAEVLGLAPQAGIKTTTRTYPLAEANRALADLRRGAVDGAAVLVP